MKYRRMDSDGDYTFGSGKYNFYEGKEAVGQAIKTKILLLKNEWWEDVEDGTPLFEQILSQKLSDESLNAVDIIIKNRILEIDEVSTILSFKSEFDRMNRRYSATLEIETVYGTLDNFELEL